MWVFGGFIAYSEFCAQYVVIVFAWLLLVVVVVVLPLPLVHVWDKPVRKPPQPAATGAEPRGAVPRQAQAGGTECVSVNVPRYGLAAAAEHAPASGSYHTARPAAAHGGGGARTRGDRCWQGVSADVLRLVCPCRECLPASRPRPVPRRCERWGGPALGIPPQNRFLVALGGSLHRLLPIPAGLPQEAADLVGVVAHPKRAATSLADVTPKHAGAAIPRRLDVVAVVSCGGAMCSYLLAFARFRHLHRGR
jgi:hypothetical protein